MGIFIKMFVLISQIATMHFTYHALRIDTVKGLEMLGDELRALAEEICRLKCEQQTVEVKAARGGCPKRLYDTLSAFSNQNAGGVIVFGIDEEAGFEPCGVYDAQDLQRKVTEQCNQMNPPVRAVFTVAEFAGVTVCSAEIPALEHTERPCYYAGAGEVRGSFIRVGDADLPMSDYEIYSYKAFRTHQHDDERTVERASMSLMNEAALNAYVAEQKVNRPGFSLMDADQVNEMLAITRKGEFTLAAVLSFGIYPQGFFPQLAITAVAVPGLEIGDTDEENNRFLDNKRIEGDLVAMAEGAIGFCKRNMKVRTAINPDTGTRADATEYPLTALREVIVNALIHRDYSPYTEGTPIQLLFFADRVEIHSPGGLYGRMTVEDLGISKPDLRNPALATMCEHRLGTENRYSGIPTIRREMARAGLPAPKFENRRNEFVVTLYNGEGVAAAEHVAGQRSTVDLLSFCAVPRTRQEIADYLGLTSVSYAMRTYIAPLLEQRLLAMTIPDKPQSRLQRFVRAV